MMTSSSVITKALRSQIVANKGSVARDVLAAERTFLAWSRTALGFVGAGTGMFVAYHRYQIVPSEQKYEKTSDQNTVTFISDNDDSWKYIYPASALLVGNGAFLLGFATRRYLRTVTLLQNDKFLVDTRGTLFAVMMTAFSTLTSLCMVMQSELQFEKPTTRGSKRE